ncbi:GNAT family N-acetyltransferase [Pseudomonas knackmussii]|uniref:GNAT family N-acetyltransferase n=1 Tax=Pseudomonas knackmussii TaxID=65741 RepID=UPI003BE24785
MIRLRHLAATLQRRGLLGTLQLLLERVLFKHWELLGVERRLDKPLALPSDLQSPPARQITAELLPAFERRFASYLPAIRAMLGQNLLGLAHLDSRGDAFAMVWISEQDYFDAGHYRCWMRVPPGCIYQFAGAVAESYRGNGLALLGMQRVWEHYHAQGFHSTRAHVDVRNLPALCLHQRLGFRETGESLHVYRLFNCLYFNRRSRSREPRLAALCAAANHTGPSMAGQKGT